MSKATVTYKMPTEDDSAVVTMGGVRFFDGQLSNWTRWSTQPVGKAPHQPAFRGEREQAEGTQGKGAKVEGLKAVHIAGGRFKSSRMAIGS
jgi:hypothetical protein